MLLRLVAVLFVSVLATACATDPARKFRLFSERAPQLQRVAVVVDVLMQTDIDGAIDGVDVEAHRALATQLAAEVEIRLVERGYAPALAHVNSGLFTTGTDRLVLVRDGKATSETAILPLLEHDSPAWTRSGVRTFLLESLQRGRDASAHGGKPDNEQPDIRELDLPVADAHALLIVRVASRDVGLLKSIGIGTTVAVASAALTGGALIAAPFFQSSCHAEFVIVDATTGELLWYHAVETRDGGSKSTHDMLFELLKPLPARAGSMRSLP